MNPEHSEQFDHEPKGYQPLELDFRDGHYWLPDGSMLEPNFIIGPSVCHKELFIEYERTFGRGTARDVTHSPRIGPHVLNTQILLPYGGHNILDDYDAIRRSISEVTSRGTEEEARNLIVKIKEFRRKYPKLYDDSDEEINKFKYQKKR